MDLKMIGLYAAAGYGAYCLYERLTKKEEDVQSSTTTTTTGGATPTPTSFPEASYSTPYSSACGSRYSNAIGEKKCPPGTYGTWPNCSSPMPSPGARRMRSDLMKPMDTYPPMRGIKRAGAGDDGPYCDCGDGTFSNPCCYFR